MLISDEYKAQLNELHEIKKDTFGVGGARHKGFVLPFLPFSRDVLDYGCGKRTLEKELGFPIKNYDPGIPGLEAPPEPADIVLCGDVLEHIEPACLDAVLDDISRVTNKLAILIIATFPAKKHFPDGRNLHLIVKDCDWWLDKLLEHFHVYVATKIPTTQGDEVLAYVGRKK